MGPSIALALLAALVLLFASAFAGVGRAQLIGHAAAGDFEPRASWGPAPAKSPPSSGECDLSSRISPSSRRALARQATVASAVGEQPRLGCKCRTERCHIS
jgi:hypothetical protein